MPPLDRLSPTPTGPSAASYGGEIPPLADHGSSFPDDGPAEPAPASGGFGSETEVFLAEFNTSQPSRDPLRKRLAAARGDNFVLRERVATLERELIDALARGAQLDQERQALKCALAAEQLASQSLREHVAALEAQHQQHLAALAEMRHFDTLLEAELRAVKASTSWRLAHNLRGLVRRCSRWARKLLPLGNR